MEQVFLVYKTDARHSYASRDIIGIATMIGIAYLMVHDQARKEGETISEDQDFNLRNIKQTQGYSGDGEFQIEPVSTNKLL